MKRTIITEVIWLGVCLIAAYLSYVFLAARAALDINMHDTYIVGGMFGPNLSLIYFVFTYFITIGFWVFLIRALYFNFSVILTDMIFLVFIGLVLYFLDYIIFVIHPPVIELPVIENTAPVKGLFYGGFYSNSYLWSVRIIKMSLVLILAFTGFMIGKRWKNGIVQ